jgi:hypothetical protein
MCEEMGGAAEAMAEHCWKRTLISDALPADLLFHSLSANSSPSKGRVCPHRWEAGLLLQNTTANATLQI